MDSISVFTAWRAASRALGSLPPASAMSPSLTEFPLDTKAENGTAATLGLLDVKSTALTLLVGSYAIRHYLPESRRRSTTDVLARWRDYLPGNFVLPHPSWRTTAWERVNPWFAAEQDHSPGSGDGCIER